jgi:hypothetical protein
MYFQHRSLFVAAIFFASFLFGMENVQQPQPQAETVLKKIQICEGDQCVERTVWTTPDRTEYRLNNVLADVNGTFASEKYYQKIAKQQKKLGLTQCPCILAFSQNPYNASITPLIDENKKQSGLFVNVDTRFETTKSSACFLTGHELNHFKEGLNPTKINEKYFQHCNYASLSLLTMAANILLLYTRSFFPYSLQPHIALFAQCGLIGSVGAYGYTYYKASQLTQQLHNIEIQCDVLSAHLGNTPEKKITIAKAGQLMYGTPRIVTTQQRKQISWPAIMHALIPFPRTHPLETTRIRDLQTLIDEQELIIAQRKTTQTTTS